MAIFREALGDHIVSFNSLPIINWSDIIGLENVKGALSEELLHPILFSDQSEVTDFSGGVLLFGPPGTGKSFLAQAAALNFGWNFINVRCSDLKSKWHGQSEKNVRLLFEFASFQKPAIIFFGNFFKEFIS